MALTYDLHSIEAYPWIGGGFNPEERPYGVFWLKIIAVADKKVMGSIQ